MLTILGKTILILQIYFILKKIYLIGFIEIAAAHRKDE